jgi:hypothetical protein
MKTSSTQAFVNQMLVYTLVMICFSGSIGLGTVWMRHQISLTANATKVLDARITEVERHLFETTTAIETERDPDVLLRRNAAWHLGLARPTPAQVVHMTEDPVRHLAAKRNRGLFGDTAVSVILPAAVRR